LDVGDEAERSAVASDQGCCFQAKAASGGDGRDPVSESEVQGVAACETVLGVDSFELKVAASLLWPDWVEIDGCVLRRDVADSEAIRDWAETAGGSVQRTESMLNHVHLYDLVTDEEEEDEGFDQRLTDVAETLAAAWRASLAATFPSRTFQVIVASAEDDYGPTVYAHSAAA
jgi:ribosomal protein S18 acetylase RimI-like enzyme